MEVVAARAKRMADKANTTVCISEANTHANYTFPSELNVDNYNGLLAVEIVRYPQSTPQSKVICYWRNKDANLSQGPEFWKAAGLVESCSGIQGTLREHKIPLWKRVLSPLPVLGLFGAIGWIAAILGNIETIQGSWEKFTAKPERVGVDKYTPPLRAVVGTQTPLPIKWTNNSMIDWTITLDKCLFSPANNRAVGGESHPSAKDWLDNNQLSQPLLLKAREANYDPRVVVTPKERGRWNIHLHGKVKGAFWPQRFPKEQKVMLEVYEPQKILRSGVGTYKQEPQSAYIDGFVEFGVAHPRGILCMAVLKNPGNVTFTRYDLETEKGLEGKLMWGRVKDPKNALLGFIWKMPESQAFTRPTFRLHLKSEPGLSEEKWKQLLGQVEFDFVED